jgi:hypothetical protein
VVDVVRYVEGGLAGEHDEEDDSAGENIDGFALILRTVDFGGSTTVSTDLGPHDRLEGLFAAEIGNFYFHMLI